MKTLVPDSLEILSIRIHRVTMAGTLAVLESMIREGGSHHVVTVNPEFIMLARHHETFRAVLNRADLAVPDGVGILYASRLLGNPIRERVTGIDIIEQFMPRAASAGFRVFLLGAGPGVAERAAAVLERAAPGLVIAGTHAGSPDPSEEDGICRRINGAKPDILLVAYGSPNQELWIARTREKLNVPVSIGVGGSFDFIAGVVQRAPPWMRSMGLEWFYRLVNQPERWRRMMALPHFAARVAVQRLGGVTAGGGDTHGGIGSRGKLARSQSVIVRE
jgi:N-acetylglucosaminyldiphosphoundecaprenol N-acetyl-beta-D-mannosaminyltransferase